MKEFDTFDRMAHTILTWFNLTVILKYFLCSKERKIYCIDGIVSRVIPNLWNAPLEHILAHVSVYY